jgi:hypothetical protein
MTRDRGITTHGEQSRLQNIILQVVKGMDVALSRPQYVLNRIYNFELNSMHFGKGELEEREGLVNQFAQSLSESAKGFALYLELLRLKETRQRFLDDWGKFTGNLGKIEWWHTDEDDGLESKPLDYLQDLRNTLALLNPDQPPPSPGIADTHLRRLEYVLRCTAQILHNMGIRPTKEQDVKDAMKKHLRTVFEDFTPTVAISKSITGFKPDGGVISLRAAIEFKFCDTEERLSTAVRGINEDLSGYSGSYDWTRFYNVVYQISPFTNEGEFQRSVKLSGNAEKWSLIVVTGGNK